MPNELNWKQSVRVSADVTRELEHIRKNAVPHDGWSMNLLANMAMRRGLPELRKNLRVGKAKKS